jgi:alanyl-tRNA synthetase
LVKIVSESGIAAGTRRIEALTGETAISHVNGLLQRLHNLSERLSCQPAELENRIEQLLEQKSELEKNLRKLQLKESGNVAKTILEAAKSHNQLRFAIAGTNAENPQALRNLGNQISGELGEGVVVLGSPMEGGKVSVIAFCSPEAIAKGHKAGEIVRQITTALGGKGGGKPDFAMGGGTAPEKLSEALADYERSIV